MPYFVSVNRRSILICFILFVVLWEKMLEIWVFSRVDTERAIETSCIQEIFPRNCTLADYSSSGLKALSTNQHI